MTIYLLVKGFKWEGDFLRRSITAEPIHRAAIPICPISTDCTSVGASACAISCSWGCGGGRDCRGYWSDNWLLGGSCDLRRTPRTAILAAIRS